MAGMVWTVIIEYRNQETEHVFRTTEQAEGGKAVGVDPSLMTARR